jgi:hypothetical protein
VRPTLKGGQAKVLNDLVELKAGETKSVTVYATGSGCRLRMRATSAGDTAVTKVVPTACSGG